LSGASKIEADNREHTRDGLLLMFEEIIFHQLHGFTRALGRGAGRCSHQRQHEALILIREEGCWHSQEEKAEYGNDDHVDRHIANWSRKEALHALFIGACTATKHAVEPAKEASLLLTVVRTGLQHRRA